MSYSIKQILKSGGLALVFAAAIFFVGLLSIDFRIKFFLIIVLLAGAVFYLKKYALFIRGDMGEMDIEDTLFSLPEEFKKFRNIVLGERGNIDFVIVGPTGIWVIEAKSHRAKVNFNGTELTNGWRRFEKDFLKQAWAEAYSLRDFLSQKLNREFKPQPILVFSNPYTRLRFGLRPVKGVYVVGASWLNSLVIGRSAEKLDLATVELVAGVLQEAKKAKK